MLLLNKKLINPVRIKPSSSNKFNFVTFRRNKASYSTYTIKGKQSDWEINVGLEIHAQIKSKTKLFSPASTLFGQTPNTQVSIIDAALPGCLPIINEYCVDQAIKTGLAIKGRINEWSSFDRKHYFYCDMPSGYQITQYFHPIVEGGELSITTDDKRTRNVRIERIQLETDSGKSLHDQHPTYTYVDLNRAGSGLMEIITEPDIHSPYEAASFVKNLQSLLRYIDVCDGNMEEGSLRCDVNVSVKKKGSKELGNRCEIKNINSIKAIIKAIEYESKRHVDVLENGGTVEIETRFFEPINKTTISGRRKEDELDYRFFPEPDLPQLYIDSERIQKIAQSLPELPNDLRKRLMEQYSLDAYEADVLASHIGASQYFEDIIGKRNPKEVCHWVINDLFGRLNEKDIDIIMSPITSRQFSQLLDLIDSGKISKRIAKDVLDMKFEGDERDPSEIIEEKGLIQLSDEKELEKMCLKVLKESPQEVKEYKEGRERRMKHFVGRIMKETKGKASGPVVTAIFERLIREM